MGRKKAIVGRMTAGAQVGKRLMMDQTGNLKKSPVCLYPAGVWVWQAIDCTVEVKSSQFWWIKPSRRGESGDVGANCQKQIPITYFPESFSNFPWISTSCTNFSFKNSILQKSASWL